MVVGFTTACAISATKAVSLNHVHGEVYSMQHNVIKFVNDLRQFCGFSPGTRVSSTNKTDHHDITEMLLKVVLYTINQPTNHAGHRMPIRLLFSSPDRKVDVRYCLHFPTVMACMLFT
jgi:hypothetical protein